MKRDRSEFWFRWKGSLIVKQGNFTKFSGSITQSQNQHGSRKNSSGLIIQSSFPKQPNLEDEIHSKWGRFVTAWFLPFLICLKFHLKVFETWSFRIFSFGVKHLDILGFHPSVHFSPKPSLHF